MGRGACHRNTQKRYEMGKLLAPNPMTWVRTACIRVRCRRTKSRRRWTFKPKPENVFVQGKGMGVRCIERRTTVIRRACFFTMNSLCQTWEAPSRTRVPSPWAQDSLAKRDLGWHVSVSANLLSRNSPKNLSDLTGHLSETPLEFFVQSCLVYTGSSRLGLLRWPDLQPQWHPPNVPPAPDCAAGDTNKIQCEVMQNRWGMNSHAS